MHSESVRCKTESDFADLVAGKELACNDVAERAAEVDEQPHIERKIGSKQCLIMTPLYSQKECQFHNSLIIKASILKRCPFVDTQVSDNGQLRRPLLVRRYRPSDQRYAQTARPHRPLHHGYP